jgi:hypothetical protein
MPISGIRFGALIIDDSVRQYHSEPPPGQSESLYRFWQHLQTSTATIFKNLERYAGVDVFVSATDPKHLQFEVKNNQTGATQSVQILHADAPRIKPSIIHWTVRKQAEAGESAEAREVYQESAILDSIRSYDEAKRALLHRAAEVKRPTDDRWPMGKILHDEMSYHIPFEQIAVWFKTLLKLSARRENVKASDLAFLPPYQNSIGASGSTFALNPQTRTIVAEATASDWLQYLWTRLSPVDKREFLYEGFENGAS